jgi:hypothetical protein
MTDTQSGESSTIELPEAQPRAKMVEQLASIGDFFQKHPMLREPHISVSVYASSRAELDALAGHFGQQPPADAGCYDGAQFYVYTDANVTVTVAYHRASRGGL